jgi:hypothetical protein
MLTAEMWEARQATAAGRHPHRERGEYVVRTRKEVTSRYGKTYPAPEWDGTPWPIEPMFAAS